MSSYGHRASTWDIERQSMSAQAAHDLDIAPGSGRKARIFTPTMPAVVLGSTQRDDIVDHAVVARVCSRSRAGAGAAPCWSTSRSCGSTSRSHVTIHLGDDIGRSMRGWPLCRARCTRRHRRARASGPPIVSRSRARSVFVSGYGEVIVNVARRGISQDVRARGARFQTMLYTRRDDTLIDVLRSMTVSCTR